MLRNFVLENVGYISLKDRYRIAPTHRDGGDSKGTKGWLEGGEVTAIRMESSMVIPNQQVKNTVAGTAFTGLSEGLSERRHPCIVNSYCVEWPEVVDQAKGTVLLCDCKLVASIRRVGRFVDS